MPLSIPEISEFLLPAFGADYNAVDLPAEEKQVLDKVVADVQEQVAGDARPTTYVLGLAIDFAILAQRLSQVDSGARRFRPSLDEQQLFKKYELVTERGGRQANTLSLTYDGRTVGIRQTEEEVVSFFNKMNRTGYPSAYVYNTGQWSKYKVLLLDCFKLSESGRYRLCERLLAYGLEFFPENRFFGRKKPRVRLFELVVTKYERTDPHENAGLMFQAIAHGFFAADRPHLNIIAAKVRTGSARQKRIADIDCYSGLDLEVSVEVKDIFIAENNVERELGNFRNQVKELETQGIAFVRDMEHDVRTELENQGIICITQAEALGIIQAWDWVKQNAALQGLLHYVAHIEQNTKATNRLLAFIKLHDLDHDALAYQNSVI